VAVVRVNVLATDRGRPLAGLTGDDFEVRDNGVLQQVEATYGESEPLDVLFAFDRSQSMAGETLGRLGDAARAVLDQLGRDDRAGLVTFNQTFALHAPMSTDRTAIREAIAEIEPGGSTSLRDTLYAALTLLGTGERRVLLLAFTDGLDSTSWLPDRTVIETARESEAVVYAVPFAQPQERLLEDVAEATGGRVVLANSDDRLRRVFLEVLREMRSRYVLTFTPTNAEPGWHTLSVRLKKGDGRVTARQGYAVR
jgi:VWFA-related protein